MIQATEARNAVLTTALLLAVLAVLAAVMLITLVGLLASDAVTRIIGHTAMTVVERIMGILLAAMSAEMILAGLKQSGVFS